LKQGQVLDDDLRWRIPLEEKARIIQGDISARHLVEGVYVATVPILPNGQVDHTTTGNTGDMHGSSWTGCYLLAAAFRFAWAKKHGTPEEVEEALSLGEQLVQGIEVLTHVSGIPGLLARKVVYGHGPAVEERLGSNERNEWHQGVGKYSHLRYRGHPSHHNYHHVIRGLSFWYYFLQKDNPNPSQRERKQMEKVRSLVAEMVDYAYKAHDLTVMTVDGRVSCYLIWDVIEGAPGTRALNAMLMATNSLKFAHWITRDPWCKEKYDQLVESFAYRQAPKWPPDNSGDGPASPRIPDHDDTEHLLPSLWLVYQLEEDPELRDFYRRAASSIFESKKNHKRSLFNYFYASLTGDLEGADLPGALETLRLYPSVTLTYPIMNSIRTDIEPGAKKAVLPFNQQPLDNAYDWKGNPFTLDGWLARPITSLAISDEDPMVWYLSDAQGTLYKSLDGGKSFSTADFHFGAVRDVTFAGGKSRIAVLATDRGIFRTDTGGFNDTWQQVKIGREDNTAHRVIPDLANPNVVWTVMDDGVYRSVDLGMENVGKSWEQVSGPMPQAEERIVFGVGTGPNPTIYAALRGHVYRRSLVDSRWIRTRIDMEDYHVVPTFRQIEVAPKNPERALFLLTEKVWGRDVPLLLKTMDGGQSFKAVGCRLPKNILLQPSRPSRGSGLEGINLTQVTFDPTNINMVYGASANGFYRSTDGGINWTRCNDGLRIPYAYRVFAPRQTPGKIFLSTPAGLHISEDNGTTWSQPILVLNGPGVCRVERGGLGYLTAYWPGRYFGYITHKQAAKALDM